MADKSETLAVRVKPQLKSRVEDWAEEKGLTVTDAHREILRRQVNDQQTIQEMRDCEEVMAKLEEIEKEIQELNQRWWRELFNKS